MDELENGTRILAPGSWVEIEMEIGESRIEKT